MQQPGAKEAAGAAMYEGHLQALIRVGAEEGCGPGVGQGWGFGLGLLGLVPGQVLCGP